MYLKELGANLGLEKDEFIELVRILVTSATSDIEKLKQAYKDGNAQHVVEAAHSLNGASGNLGFSDFSRIAKTAEDNARDENLDGAEEIMSSMEERLGKIKEQLEKT